MDDARSDEPAQHLGYGATCKLCHSVLLQAETKDDDIEDAFAGLPVWMTVRRTTEIIEGSWLEVIAKGAIKIPWCSCKADQLQADDDGHLWVQLDFGNGPEDFQVIHHINARSETVSYGIQHIKVPQPKEVIHASR